MPSQAPAPAAPPAVPVCFADGHQHDPAAAGACYEVPCVPGCVACEPRPLPASTGAACRHWNGCYNPRCACTCTGCQ